MGNVCEGLCGKKGKHIVEEDPLQEEQIEEKQEEVDHIKEGGLDKLFDSYMA